MADRFDCGIMHVPDNRIWFFLCMILKSMNNQEECAIILSNPTRKAQYLVSITIHLKDLMLDFGNHKMDF